MSILYQIKNTLANFDNKLLLSNYFNKFIVRNQLDTTTYLVENGLTSFTIKKTRLKNHLKYSKISFDEYLKSKKFNKGLAKFVKKHLSNNLNCLTNTNPNTKINVKTISKFKSKKKYIKKKAKSFYLDELKARFLKKNYVGFSFYGKYGILKHKKHSKFQISHFFKKKKIFNYLKHRLFLLNFIYKFINNKIQFSVKLLKPRRGGCWCLGYGLLSVKAFIPKLEMLSVFSKKHTTTYFIRLFQYFNTLNIFDIKLVYCTYIYFKKQKNYSMLDSKYKQNLLFPLCIVSIKKIKKKVLKKRRKKMYSRKQLTVLKKRKQYFKKKFFYNTYRIILGSSKSILNVKTQVTKESLLLLLKKQTKIILKKISLRIQKT